MPGSYSVNISTLRSVTSLRQAGARLSAVWVNHSHESGVGSAEGDHLVPSALAIAAFETARQPKELIILPGGHFDAYTKGFDASSGQARDWFTRHLAA